MAPAMTVHLVKMAVGVESVAHLSELQTLRRRNAGSRDRLGALRQMTRHGPRRSEELVDGGSIYWVIKGFIRVRQGIVAIDKLTDAEGRPLCALVLDENLVRTELMASRPFQGWRYFSNEMAPPDARTSGDAYHGMPLDMAVELRALGLL